MFTHNNPDEKMFAILQDYSSWCTFIAYQLEKGKEGTPHIQGYVELEQQKSLRSMRLQLPGTHLEPRMGSQKQAIDYCSKKDTRIDGPFQHGTPKHQGQRSDLNSIAERLRTEEIGDLLEEFPSQCIRYYNGLRSFKEMTRSPRSSQPDVWWVSGPTGSGKSRFASEQKGSQYWKPLPSKWWCGYTQQDIIILDDMRKDCFKFHELLRLFDRYPLKCEIKGGMVDINSPTIIVTSCHKPEDFYETREDIGQLLRRINRQVILENE